ncbi:MAG: hypothetical protein KAT53_08605 [Dehalococcoidia bacterium]|nr:hypothetical protein [Dehalococcoidia bacterium]
MDQTTGQDPIPFFDLWELDAKEREDALQVLTQWSRCPQRRGMPWMTSLSTNSLLA